MIVIYLALPSGSIGFACLSPVNIDQFVSPAMAAPISVALSIFMVW